jgi:dinuclear metal center YbgI/SA1388 family protein
MKIKDITNYLETIAPLEYQESYDNSGLLVGNANDDINSVLISLDVTEQVIDEAIEKKIDLIISHHPIIFVGLKKLNGNNYIERVIIKAIKNNIAIYSIHTNLDSVLGGVNSKICEWLGLINTKILSPVSDKLFKLTYFVPVEYSQSTREAVFEAGAGNIGNYYNCSYNLIGEGTFEAGENTNPFIGEKGELHTEKETRIEVVVPQHNLNKVIVALEKAHPYEEVAYDIYQIKNKNQQIGMGMIGELDTPIDEMEFLNKIKKTFSAKSIRYTKLLKKPIIKVAVCGGSGSSLLNKAIANNADIFISADFKYHQFFDADNKIIIADIGHFESEQVTKDLIYDLLIKKFPNFAVRKTEINSNPINYL